MTYQLKHYGKQNQNSTQDWNDVEDESRVESDKEDWRIDLEDDNKSTGEFDENIDELIKESQQKTIKDLIGENTTIKHNVCEKT